MERIPEPELMEEEEQAQAYAAADFSEPHERFVDMFTERFAAWQPAGHVLDLGCGPGDVAFRFARRFPSCTLHGVDGSTSMLRQGERFLARSPELRARVTLVRGLLPEARLPREGYDAVICNSLLHHLHDPQVLWRSVRRFALPGAPVFVVDLMRPESRESAARMVTQYASEEPPVLQRDFHASLLAAFSVEEVRRQLREAGLSLEVTAVSDRHLAVHGSIAS